VFPARCSPASLVGDLVDTAEGDALKPSRAGVLVHRSQFEPLGESDALGCRGKGGVARPATVRRRAVDAFPHRTVIRASRRGDTRRVDGTGLVRDTLERQSEPTHGGRGGTDGPGDLAGR
jgi:hypothetical protein